MYEPSIYVYGGVLMAIMIWRLEYSLNRALAPILRVQKQMTYELRLITRNDSIILSRPLHTVDFCHASKLVLRRRRLLLTAAARHHTSGLMVYSVLSARGRDTGTVSKSSTQDLERHVYRHYRCQII